MSFTCEHITKVYGGREVLKDVSLTLEPGKIYGLIGRNGAGKTTLLSILTAQNPAAKGTVSVDGEPVWENRKALEKLCFSRELNVGAESGIAAIKVKEYLRIAATYYAGWDKEMEQRLVALFELDRKKKLGKLSKGMLSMVTIIVAMCSKAPYTLLDEPVAGLDVVAREQFYKLLLEEYAATGRTFLISTHVIEEAADVLEEVIILHEGRQGGGGGRRRGGAGGPPPGDPGPQQGRHRVPQTRPAGGGEPGCVGAAGEPPEGLCGPVRGGGAA